MQHITLLSVSTGTAVKNKWHFEAHIALIILAAAFKGGLHPKSVGADAVMSNPEGLQGFGESAGGDARADSAYNTH